jgi:hypothetical protein
MATSDAGVFLLPPIALKQASWRVGREPKKLQKTLAN